MPKSLLKRGGENSERQYQMEVLLKKEFSTVLCIRTQILAFRVD